MRYLLLLLFFTSLFSARAQYRVAWDEHGSSAIGGENMYSVNAGLHFVIDKILPNGLGKEERIGQKLGGIGYRLAKLVLADAQVDLTMHLFQHEFFGHGFRYREFGFRNNSFVINAYPPYGPGGGFARTGRGQIGRSLGIHERVAMNSGGMEAAGVLAQTVRRKWLISGEIPYRDWLLYTAGLLDVTGYIYTTKWFTPSSGNDVVSYTTRVNEAYGFNNAEQWALTYQNLERRSLVNLVNTYQLLAFYTVLKTYLWDGETATALPMLTWGQYQFLPSIRFGLSPFGTEFYLENDMVRADRVYQFYLRLGNTDLESSWGVGGSHYYSISKRLLLQGQLDVWNQPSLLLGGVDPIITDGGLGGRLTFSCDYKPSPVFPIGIYAQIGGKSTGYVAGETLNAGLIFRLGLSYIPDAKKVD